MTRRATLVSAMLLAGLVVAVISATAALRFIGGGAFGPGGQPLTPAEVQRSLAQQVAAPQPSQTRAMSQPTAPPSRPSGPAPVTGNYTSTGGAVYASCLSGQVRLTSWIPAQGYLADGYASGPAASAWVKFKASGTEVTVTATCAGGHPRFTTATDDRGGGEGGGHGGGGGGDGGSGRGGG